MILTIKYCSIMLNKYTRKQLLTYTNVDVYAAKVIYDA